MSSSPKVFVGMSGGVDSSLAAALLVEQGYQVTGVYMKNWTRDLPGNKCPWVDDQADAKRVAVKLGIDFKVFDFEKEYKQKVVDYMINEYKKGRTPNPDIMCNQEVKFKLFLETALENGADMIATGHYARVVASESATALFSKQASLRHDDSANVSLYPAELSDVQTSSDIQETIAKSSGQTDSVSSISAVADSQSCARQRDSIKRSDNINLVSSVSEPVVLSEHLEPEFSKASGPLINPARSRSEKITGELTDNHNLLLQAFDKTKDQTYFLYRITSDALGKTLFPIGEFKKTDVRKMAEKRGLSTAAKKDSQGICFIGQVGIQDFLGQYVDQKPGEIIDKKSGKILGYHDGAIFYTLGQRHGLDVGGGLPYYVVDKDMDKNLVYVTTDLNDKALWRKKITLTDVHWINQAPKDGKYQIRMRHLAPFNAALLSIQNKEATLSLENPIRAVASGQSVVAYDGEICLGGGIVV